MNIGSTSVTFVSTGSGVDGGEREEEEEEEEEESDVLSPSSVVTSV